MQGIAGAEDTGLAGPDPSVTLSPPPAYASELVRPMAALVVLVEIDAALLTLDGEE